MVGVDLFLRVGQRLFTIVVCEREGEARERRKREKGVVTEKFDSEEALVQLWRLRSRVTALDIAAYAHLTFLGKQH